MFESSSHESLAKADIKNARDLQALLYREIGLSAVAAALGVPLDGPAEPKTDQPHDIPTIRLGKSLAA